MKLHVVIIGAGPAGAIAACSLRPDYEVTLIDPAPLGDRPFRIGESLPAASRRILTDLGLRESFLSQNHRPSHNRQSRWGSDEVQHQDSIQNLDGCDYLLDRPLFENSLVKQAIARGAKYHQGKLQSAAFRQEAWRIQTQDTTIRADWVIDASGRQAHFARKINIRAEAHDRLVAHWTLGHSAGKHQGSYVQSTKTGWWYTASTPSHGRVLAHFTDADLVPVYQLHDNAHSIPFLHELLLEDQFELNGADWKTAAHSSSLSSCHGRQWHAIGDASLAFDPLSSQGIFHALYTGHRSSAIIREDAGDHYQAEISQIRTAYVKHAKLYYEMEKRWSNSPFWQRRQTSTPTLLSL